MTKRIFLLLIAIVLLAMPLAANAQSEFDPEGGVSYLIASLPGYPDPVIVTMLSGGDVDASTLGAGCVGNIFYVPDVEIEITSSVPTLRAYYSVTDSGGDTTLVVQKPDGTFTCNDDFSGSDPMVEIPSPPTGTYRFWVGTFGSTNNYPGYLVITNGASMPGALASDILGTGGGTVPNTNVQATATPAGVEDPLAQFAPTLTAAAATVNALNTNLGGLDPTLTAAAATVNAALNTNLGGLDPTLTAAAATVNAALNTAVTPGINFQNMFGASATPGANTNVVATPAPGNNSSTVVGPNGLITATIGGGFTPDPLTQALAAGGSIDSRGGNFGPDCRGFISGTPNYNISYTGGGTQLRIFFSSPGDTTLIVQKPDGTFACNDDFPGTLNPLIDIANPAAGNYTIWVGTYTQGETLNGNLFITANSALDPTNS